MNMTKKLNDNAFKNVKVSTKQTEQDENEKEVLFEAIEKLDEDISNMIIGKNILLAELEFYNPSAEKLENLISSIGTWEYEIGERLKELDDAKEIFLKRRATHKISNAVDEL